MKTIHAFVALITLALSATAAEISSAAYSTLHRFSGGDDGFYPSSALIFDQSGNLYGTTQHGGSFGGGTVFRMSPPAPGKTVWSKVVIYSFNNSGKEGYLPRAGVILDKAGNLYGTTVSGGAFFNGAVFELTAPSKNGVWAYTTLHSFNPNGVDGFNPTAGLVADKAGNLYGTTLQGGANGGGTIYELAKPTTVNSIWAERILYSFTLNGASGSSPSASLVFDSKGCLYGTTQEGGGSSNGGTVFKLMPPTAGKTRWTESVLHAFAGNDGSTPINSVVLDFAGDIYGTTYSGGSSKSGTVFELLTPTATRPGWVETVLHSFVKGNDASPVGPLILDAAGNVYGTTSGTQDLGTGTVFKLMPPKSGSIIWTEKVIHEFGVTTGYAAQSGVVMDSVGNLYGDTLFGGNSVACPGDFTHQPEGCGVVFKVTP